MPPVKLQRSTDQFGGSEKEPGMSVCMSFPLNVQVPPLLTIIGYSGLLTDSKDTTVPAASSAASR